MRSKNTLSHRIERIDTLTLTGWLTLLLATIYAIYAVIYPGGDTSEIETEQVKYYMDAVAFHLQHSSPGTLD